MQQVELRGDDEATFLHPAELEEEVRRGRVAGSAEVRYAPWTGTEFARIESLPALAGAMDAPGARAAARLAGKPFPWGTALLCLLLLLAFFLQSRLHQLGLEPERLGAVGFEPTLLEGAWWSAWTAPWLHGNALHLAFNLPILAYSSFRVERVLGMTGLLLVLLGASLGAALLIIPFSELPVVGSSILAYGAWGAQLGLGLRLGEAIPIRERGAYGWRSYLLFALFLLPGFSAPSISVLGHLGGYLGGLAVSLGGPGVALAPRTALGLTRLRTLGAGLGLLALPAALAWGLASSPTLLCSLSRSVGASAQGMELFPRGWLGVGVHPGPLPHLLHASPAGGLRGGLARGLGEEGGASGRGNPTASPPVAGGRGPLPGGLDSRPPAGRRVRADARAAPGSPEPL